MRPLRCNFLCLAVRSFAAIFLLISTTVAIAGEDSTNGYVEPPLSDDDRSHWSFQSIEPIETPASVFPKWRHNPIDDFIGRSLHEQGLRPQPQADRYALLRRLKFDLLGLPPSPQEIEGAINADGQLAFGRLVDEFLQRPAYGERWAQHWLDLARFAETDGFEHDRTRPNAWKYRDWVIQSLNADMPYDEFLKRQIAGDELWPQDESARIATMFCLSGPDMPDINLMEERQHSLLTELTSTVGEVVLALQVGCAQCHDHKYDPISQADFYRMRAIFRPAVQLKKNVSISAFREQFPYRGKSHVMLRGDFRSPGPEVSPSAPRVVSIPNTEFKMASVERSSGRRTAFAEWLVDSRNPLTARVIVNRVWQSHFGRGLVDTPSDFGLIGSDPSHPELLDWLATDFVAHDWSLKQLHRVILTSATWQQASKLSNAADAEAEKIWGQALEMDSDVRLLSRSPRRRLDGEVIRDAMLATADLLNRKANGPGIRPPLPPELKSTLLPKQWDVTKDTTEHDRRSIYVFARRNLRYPIFEAFDRPSANASCARRNVSTTAPQSLHLLNSKFSLRVAKALGDSVAAKEPTTEGQLLQLFLRTMGRPATAAETRDALLFLADTANEETAVVRPMTHLALAILNSNEFLFVD